LAQGGLEDQLPGGAVGPWLVDTIGEFFLFLVLFAWIESKRLPAAFFSRPNQVG